MEIEIGQPNYGPIEFDPPFFDFCHSLWAQRSWVHRKVDTLTIETDDIICKNASYDIDTDNLRIRLAEVHTLRGKRIPLPLTIEESTVIFDIDVELDGNSQSIGSAAVSAQFAQAVTFSSFYEYYPCQQALRKEIFKVLSEVSFWALLKTSIKYLEYFGEVIKLQISRFDPRAKDSINTKITGTNDFNEFYSTIDLDYIQSLEDVSELLQSYTIFSEHFTTYWGDNVVIKSKHIQIILIEPPRPGQSCVLKVKTKHFYTKQDSTMEEPLRVIDRFQLTKEILPQQMDHRYHLRIEAPPEYRILEMKMGDERIFPPVTPQKFKVHSSKKNLIKIHSANNSKGRLNSGPIDLAIELNYNVFHLKAFAIFVILIFYTTISTIGHNKGGNESEFLALMIALGAAIFTLPTLFYNSNESSFATSSLLVYRSVLGWAIGLTLLANISSQMTSGVISTCLGLISIAIPLAIIATLSLALHRYNEGTKLIGKIV